MIQKSPKSTILCPHWHGKKWRPPSLPTKSSDSQQATFKWKIEAPGSADTTYEYVTIRANKFCQKMIKLYFQYLFTAWMVRACQVQPYTEMEAVRIPRTRLQQILFMKCHHADNAFSVDCFTTLLCGNFHVMQSVGRVFNKLFETLTIHNCVRLIFTWRINVAQYPFLDP